MSFKDILAPILSVASDEPALEAAEAVADLWSGQVTALLLEIQPDPIFARDGVTPALVVSDYLERLHVQFKEDERRLQARASARAPIGVGELLTSPSRIDADLGAAARLADLTVLTARGEPWQQEMRTAVIEGTLFGSGRPLLLTPPDWRKRPLGRNILVAWNGRREAARALADATPFLNRADRVRICSVGGGDHVAGGAERAVEHLSRRGVEAEACNLARTGSDGDTLLLAAQAMKADLIVMGGYGRARLSETVFGGVTRELIKQSPVPLFMAH